VHVLSDRLQTAQEEARHLKDNASDWKEIKDKLDKETKRAKAAVEERDRLRVQLDEMTAERDKLASRGR
jgi:DNA repair ATPase RecN